MNRKCLVHLLLVQPGPSHYYLLPGIIAITFWLYPLAFGLFYLSSLLSTQWPVWTFKNHLSYNIVLFKTLQWLLKSLRGKKRKKVLKEDQYKKTQTLTHYHFSDVTSYHCSPRIHCWGMVLLELVKYTWFCLFAPIYYRSLPRPLCKTNPSQLYIFFKSVSFALYFRILLVTMWKWKSLSRVQLYDPMDCIVHGILQARILEWVAFLFSRGSSQPRNWTRVSCIAGRFFTNWAMREAHIAY